MAFRFALGTVLRVRELAVEQEERMLARILGEIEALRGALVRTEDELRDSAQVREKAYLVAALPAFHLQGSYAAAAELRVRAARIRHQLTEFERLRVQQIARYEEAYRRRELLSGMEEQSRAAWLLAESKREGKAADEAFLARRRARQLDTPE